MLTDGAGAMIGKPTDNDFSCPAFDNQYGQKKTAAFLILLLIESPMKVNACGKTWTVNAFLDRIKKNHSFDLNLTVTRYLCSQYLCT